MSKPTNLHDLRASGWDSKPVKQEIRDNFLRMLAAGEALFPGIVGYDNTVIPEINIALLAGHDMLFLGEKGQAKSRLMRSLVRFLDEEIPYLDIPGVAGPRGPVSARSRSAGKRVRRRARPRTTCRSPGGRARSATPSGSRRARSSPTSSARSTRPSWPAASSMSAEEALHFGLIPRMHRGIFAMNELPELDELVQVGLFNILEERDVQIRGYPIQFDIDVLILFSANPATYNRSGKVIPQLKDRIGSRDPDALPAASATTGIEIMEQEAGRRPRRRLPGRRAVLHEGDHRADHRRGPQVEVHRPAVGRQRPLQHRQLPHDGRPRPAAGRACSARSRPCRGSATWATSTPRRSASWSST